MHRQSGDTSLKWHEVEEAFKLVDHNEDGKIDRTEFQVRLGPIVDCAKVRICSFQSRHLTWT